MKDTLDAAAVAVPTTSAGRTHGDCLRQLRSIIEQFDLSALRGSLDACEELHRHMDGTLDVAVFGQFKAGKSSLLNTLLDGEVLPVGVLPVTTVVTRITAGTQPAVRVTYRDGSTEQVAPASIADFVSESRNPGNHRMVAIVDVFTPALSALPGLRLVDTPGLGSVFAHNTQVTRDWLPNVAVALVAISADRPLADEDRRLIAALRPHAPRIAVVVTKVDLLTDPERDEVRAFLTRQLGEVGRPSIPVLCFSTRRQTEHWTTQLMDELLRPLSDDVRSERQRTLEHKLASLASACRDCLTVALRAAEQTEADRRRLAEAVLDESTTMSIVQDELRLASERVRGACRPAFEEAFHAHRDRIAREIKSGLVAAMSEWDGNLAVQTAQFQRWMREHLIATLQPISSAAVSIADDLVLKAEGRFRRVAEAFRDRLNHNVNREMGIALSAVAWEMRRPAVGAPPVAVGQTFMTQWELLWWLIPMRLAGRLFRRHCAKRVFWEVEKNLARLVSDWSDSTATAINDLASKAAEWAGRELTMLSRLLARQPTDAEEVRAALSRLDAMNPRASPSAEG